MGTQRTLITLDFVHPGDEIDRRLTEAGIQTVYDSWHGGRTEEEMIAILRDVDAVLADIDPFTARVLADANRLKVISRPGVGYDAIDVQAASAHGIAVCTTPGANRHSVAEMTLAMILQCARKIGENEAEVRRGGWTRVVGNEIAGSTLGIVGLGTIGKEVAQRARAFEMRVVAYDLVQDQQFAEEHQVAYVPLEQLLRESDYVSLHVFLDQRTQHLINAERLAMMKPSACLINTARGPIVDEEALIQALEQKQIAGAALDVFTREPLPTDSPLRALDNVYLYPHLAGSTQEVFKASGLMAAENVIRVLRGERPLHTVNPEALQR
ncbi:MAG: phosphoglycerate dehydrogenase [Actinobacteria bacterium]|nr:phosphoglycerate dehydrogenase [Actinomycetota bacterium]